MRVVALGALAALFAVPNIAAAQYQPYRPFQPYRAPSYQAPPAPHTTYDWQSGNRYTTTPHEDGGATVRGSNMNTGSTWRTEIQPNGNERGTDSRGNMWTYNRSSGSYMNTDGTVCIGTGALRTCN